MKYVIGIDLGTSAVKIILVNQHGDVIIEVSKAYPLIQIKTGYSEQKPQDWFEQTLEGLREILEIFTGEKRNIKGISFSGQMHGLVLLDKENEVLRNAILWNDTRTTEECNDIYNVVGRKRLLQITKNPALEGFTLPKLLWVRRHEPETFKKVSKFLLPKDYVRYRLTNQINIDYSDAAGTLLLDVGSNAWSTEICKLLNLDPLICPPLINSYDSVGNISESIAELTGLSKDTLVFAGGADNACGAIGAGILNEEKTLCSIGTSGVVLSYESNADSYYDGQVHLFNHGAPSSHYIMGVTLSAGYSLSWFRETFAKDETYEELLRDMDNIPVGSNGLLFTPYLVGERTPYNDANIRGCFIGMDSAHNKKDFIRAVLEGITFSLKDVVEIFRENKKTINTIVSIGGGSKNDVWLQMQADIFNARIIKLQNEQGPGMGAAMLAAYGCGWFNSLEKCADVFLRIDKEYYPNKTNVYKYQKLYNLYKDVYTQTKGINHELMLYRK